MNFIHMLANMKYRVLGGALFLHHLEKHKCPILHHLELVFKKDALKSVLVSKNCFLALYFRASVGDILAVNIIYAHCLCPHKALYNNHKH
jgi:hypothetical protein